MFALVRDPGVKNITPGRPNGYMYVSVFMSIGLFIAFFFSAIFVLYINSFLMKQRKKELGLYTTPRIVIIQRVLGSRSPMLPPWSSSMGLETRAPGGGGGLDAL